jgi:hypothetical protein
LDNPKPKHLNFGNHAVALENTLVVPTMSSSKSILPELSSNNINARPMRSKTSNARKSYSHQNTAGPSPFPELDKFINSVLGRRKGIIGSIRAWSTADSNANEKLPSIITYHMKDNRWCENINRCHKSNNVMWNVSITDKCFWQSCHDPDCRMASFRGKVQPLPLVVLTTLPIDSDTCKSKQCQEQTCQNNERSDDDMSFIDVLTAAIDSDPNLFP